jgi:hypothetical protein
MKEKKQQFKNFHKEQKNLLEIVIFAGNQKRKTLDSHTQPVTSS